MIYGGYVIVIVRNLVRMLQRHTIVYFNLVSPTVALGCGLLEADTEMTLMQKLEHEHVLRLEDVILDQQEIHLVMSICRGGDLQNWPLGTEILRCGVAWFGL